MQLRLPDLGEGILEAELVEWLVHPGDVVQHGQGVAEIMTDKATVELPSPITGTVSQLLAEPGQMVAVGAALLDYEAESPAAKSPEKPPDEEPPPAPSAAGEQAESRESPAAAKGQAEKKPGAKSGNGRTHARDAAKVKAAPAVRQMASQLGIDLSRVRGSGPGNRILIADLAACVTASAAARHKERKAASTRKSRPVAEQTEGQYQAGSRIPLRGLRRKVAERMTHATQTIPHYSLVDECDVTELVRLRKSLQPRFADAGIKLTYLPFFVRAVVAALREVPLANASLDTEAGEITLHDRYDIGIATETPAGLVVPVLHAADRLELPALARELQRLTQAARAGRAQPEELRGSTFTITSFGGIGGLIATPIINEPEVGILGIGRIMERPAFDQAGRVVPANFVYLSFTMDHRVIDGAVTARLSNAVIQRLKNPATLLPISF